MKPYFLPAATALIGFIIAWIAKPTPQAPVATAGTTATVEAPARTTPRADPRENAGPAQRPVEVNASDFPLADQAQAGPKSSDEAKMLRLSEALDLSVDQQAGVRQLVSDTQASSNLDLTALEDITNRGKAMEDGLQKLLTPEQFKKFQEILVRERENRTELRAQRMLADTIEFIDLSPTQRDEVLGRLRQKSKADLQSIPAAATLLFDKSILPNGGKELSPDGLLLLAQMGEKISTGTPQEVYADVMARHKQELEAELKCFDGILTPAQMGQYFAAHTEKQAAIERARQHAASLRSNPVDGAVLATQPGAPPLEEIITDDDDRDDYQDDDDQ